MNSDQLKKKKLVDELYWKNKLETKKKYEESEAEWKKELARLNPEHP